MKCDSQNVTDVNHNNKKRQEKKLTRGWKASVLVRRKERKEREIESGVFAQREREEKAQRKVVRAANLESVELL